MTVSEMCTAVRLQLDKTSSFEYASFLDEELEYWLNEAQNRFVKQRLFGNNYRNEKYDNDQKRIDDLNPLVKVLTSLTLSTSSLGTNVVEYTLPRATTNSYPYMFYLNALLINSSSVYLAAGNIIPYTNINKYLKDSINNPYIKRPLVTFYDDKIAFIYGTEFVPATLTLTYIRIPKTLVISTTSGYYTTTCELPTYTHNEIVSMCVELLLENIESSRVQTYPQINASKAE